MNPTVPRRDIAAMYSSPGPAYALPDLIGIKSHDPRSVHTKAPAYSLSYRSGKFVNDCSPGPQYLPDPAYTRVGRKGDPIYSMYSRPKDMTMFKTPGPGTYSPESCGLTAGHTKQPAYSFGKRFQSRKTDSTPGANCYTLPNVIGPKTYQSHLPQSPVYSMPGRRNVGSFCQDLARAPGPGAYKIVDTSTNKDRAPSYSMTSRNMLPGDSTRKPGPGAHSPEKVVKTRYEAPKFSFGIRHSPYVAPLIVDPLCD